METVNALQLRQSLGRVLQRLKRTGRPILLEKDRKPAAVIISLEDYRKRFVDVEVDRLRVEMVERIKGAEIELPRGLSSLDLLRELRGEERR
ncbi:MAG: type II toxin-antitoxin system Phd/YefM family antitoxin [Deltaproteobacteria bacterium]|nr:type II toxin-antitoxin system Phd/YefM family antitoxin [Deltaproteobacteria bacterium]